MRSEGLRRFAAVLVFSIVIFIMTFAFIGSDASFESPILVAILNTIFLSGVAFAVATMATKGFLATGSVQVILLGSGALTFGVGSLLAGWLMKPGELNTSITIFNTGALVSAAFHTFGAASPYRDSLVSRLRRRGITVLYVITLAGMFLITVLALFSFLPPFVNPDGTATMASHGVTLLTIALFVLAALMYYRAYYELKAESFFWYSLGLLLTGVGLFTIPLGEAGSPIAWLGRSAQYIGGMFFLVSVVVTWREAGHKGSDIQAVVARLFPESATNYRLLVDTAGEAIIGLNREGRILLWNPTAEAMFGYSYNEAVGKRLVDLVVPEEDAESFSQWTNDPQAIPLPDRTRELVLLHRDNSEIEAELSIAGSSTTSGQLTAVVIRDITERKLAERLFWETQRRNRTILESITDGFITFDRDWRCIYVNAAAARFLRRTRDELLGKMFWETFPEALKLKFFTEFTRATSENVPVRFEEFYPKPLNAWFECHCYPTNNGLTVYFRDVTEKIRAEETIRHQSQLVDSTSDSIVSYLLNDEGEFIIRTWNKGAEKIFGWKAEEVIGRPHESFARPEFPSPAIAEEADRQFFEKGYWSGEFTIRGKNGAGVPVFGSRTALLDSEGRIIGGVSVHHDITDLKRAQAAVEESNRRLHHLIDSSIIGIILVDGKNNIILDANDAFLKIVGYGRDDSASGKLNLSAMIPDEQRHLGDKALEEVLGQGHCSPYETEYVRKDGTRVPVLIGASLWDSAKDNPSFICFVIDITEQKRTHEQLIAYERLATIGQLSGSVAHELRNPLATIDSSVFFLERTLRDLDEKSRNHLERMRASINRSIAIIESLLNLAREKKLQLLSTDIRNAINDAVSASHVPPTIEIMRDFPPDRVVVKADRNQLQMAFQNIVTNAVQAMGGNGTIKIAIQPRPGMVEISFSDTGPGIPPENISRIFQPLFTTKAKGIGLGLAITKSVIEKHQGTIVADSEPGKGATFIVRLPVDAQEIKESHRPPKGTQVLSNP